MSSVIKSPAFSVSMTANITNSTGTQAIKSTLSDESGQTFTVGSSAGQVNKAYSAVVSVNTASATLLDLTSLTNALGEAVSFSAIEAIKITLQSTTVGENIAIGGGTNALFAALPSALTLIATSAGNQTFLIKTPMTVDSTHKILQLAAAAGSAVQVAVSIYGR